MLKRQAQLQRARSVMQPCRLASSRRSVDCPQRPGSSFGPGRSVASQCVSVPPSFRRQLERRLAIYMSRVEDWFTCKYLLLRLMCVFDGAAMFRVRQPSANHRMPEFYCCPGGCTWQRMGEPCGWEESEAGGRCFRQKDARI